jgi:hypothetical protein
MQKIKILSSLLHISSKKDSMEIYFVIFGHLYDFLLIFKVWKLFG